MQAKKLDATQYNTDKAEHQHYLRQYEQYFRPLLDKDIRLFELGIKDGGSLALWRDYFERGLIVGLDIQEVSIDDPTGRIRTFQGMQQDTALLDRIAMETAPDGFDVIIDDCSHIGDVTRASFWHLFDNHLKAGGLYVIEDWSTGYWPSWSDGVSFRPRTNKPYRRSLLRSGIGRLMNSPLARVLPLEFAKRIVNRRQFRSHNYGLVGFVKELVDECGMSDITRPDFGRPPHRPSKFKEMKIAPGQVFIVKA